MEAMSRRKLIGSTAGGAALIWATPVVTTVGLLPAAAASGGESWSLDANRPLTNTGWNNQLITGTQSVDQVCTTVTSFSGNTPQMVALNSDPATNESWNTLDYATYFFIRNGEIRMYVYESGSYQGYFGVGNIGDQYCIIRDPNTGVVTYTQNGVVFFTSATTSLATLYVDSSFYYSPGFWNGDVSMEITSC